MTATTMDFTRPLVTAAPAGHASMMDLVRSEWTKLRTVRSTMWTLGFVVVLGIGLSAIATAETTAHWATMNPGSKLGFDPTQTSLIGVAFAQLVMGILGVLVMSGEYGTGTIRATLSAAPVRWKVLVAKAGVFGAVALVVSEVVSFIAYFLGQALLKAPTPHTDLSSPQALRAVVGAGLYLTVLGPFALGLATIIRHTAGAISAFVGVLLVFPLVAGALPQSIQQTVHRYLPANIGNQLTQFHQGPTDGFSPWVGFAILCGYALAALLIGGILLNRRDA
jgi:ABC-2 type transport system permease protein